MEMWESVIRMVSSLGVVLALILGLLALTRSRIAQRFLPAGSAQLVKILGSGPLGSRKHVMVVAVAGDVLILGTTATDLVPLGKVTDPELVQRLLSEASLASSASFCVAQSVTRKEGSHAAS